MGRRLIYARNYTRFIPTESRLHLTAVIGGISFVLYGMISAVGVRNIVENRVDFSKSRNLIITAIILVISLGLGTVSIALGNITISLSALAVASIAGIVLNAILPGKDYEFNN